MKILHVETGRHLYGGPQQVVWLLRGLGERAVDNVLVCVPSSDVDRSARAAGLEVFNVPCAGDLDLSFAWWLGQVVRWHAPDLVHCHSRRGADLMGGLAARLTGVPAILSRRVDHPEPAILAAFRYRPFRQVIAISESVAASLRESGLDARRITVIRSAVDHRGFGNGVDAVDFRRRFGLDPEALVIAAAGQLIPRKGHRYLLEAMAGLVRSHPKLVLLVFGQGELAAELEEQAGQLELGEHVQFVGFREDLDDYLGAADLLVHPALREGLGVAMLKAQAAGVPVVAFDVAGSREAVAHDRSGILVPPKDVRGLGQAISRLLDDPVLRRRLGEAARERMRSEFSIEAMVDQHLQVYEATLDESR
jgi:glycosyltransferase involved in cell wall biosynthesis